MCKRILQMKLADIYIYIYIYIQTNMKLDIKSAPTGTFG